MRKSEGMAMNIVRENGRGRNDQSQNAFPKAMVLSAGLALLPSCAGAYAQAPLAETSGPDRGGGYVQPARPPCVPVPERSVSDVPRPGGGIVRHVTLTREVMVGDYAIPVDLGDGNGLLKVTKIDNESVGLTFLESRNRVWLLQYGQESYIGEPAGRIKARVELCQENLAKLTITYPTGDIR